MSNTEKGDHIVSPFLMLHLLQFAVKNIHLIYPITRRLQADNKHLTPLGEGNSTLYYVTKKREALKLPLSTSSITTVS